MEMMADKLYTPIRVLEVFAPYKGRGYEPCCASADDILISRLERHLSLRTLAGYTPTLEFTLS